MPFTDPRTSLAGHLWLLAVPLLLLGPGPSARQSSVLNIPDRSEEGVEHFLLEWRGETPHPARGYQGLEALELAARRGSLGLVEYRRHRTETSWQLEQEVGFPFEGIRLLAVEDLDPANPRLVWRELSTGAGRTVFAEWTAGSEELRAKEWGVGESLRGQNSTRRGAVMPLYLLELARTSRVTTGRFEVFDPLARDLQTWTVNTAYRRADGARDPRALRREVEFIRSDGSLAGRYVFRGSRLIGFCWQEGAVRAKPISAREYADYRLRWGLHPEMTPSTEEGERVKDV